MYAFPKTRIGKYSFWIGVSAFILIDVQYWIAMVLANSGVVVDAFRYVTIVLGILLMLGLCVSGITSIIAITKYRDPAFLLFVSAVIGCLGIVFVLAEFLFPHS